MNIPEEIDTELGKATIGIVRASNAVKQYLCPLCDEQTDPGESHLVAVPVVEPELRRHIHTECLMAWQQQGLSVKLHPFNTHIIRQYM